VTASVQVWSACVAAAWVALAVGVAVVYRLTPITAPTVVGAVVFMLFASVGMVAASWVGLVLWFLA